MRGINKLILPILAVSLIASMAMVTPISRAATTAVFVEPMPVVDEALIPGEHFSVYVSVSDVVDLYGIDLHLSYDSLMVTAEYAEFVVDLFPADPFVNLANWDTPGDVWLAASMPLGAPNGVSGTGKIFRIDFEVVSTGSCLLTPVNEQLLDSGATPITHVVYSGFFANVPVAIGADIVKRRKYNRPEHNKLILVKVGSMQTFYAEIENTGQIPLIVEVWWDVYDDMGMPLDTPKATAYLLPGEIKVVSAAYNAGWDYPKYFYTEVSIHWDSNGDGVLDSTGPTTRFFWWEVQLTGAVK